MCSLHFKKFTVCAIFLLLPPFIFQKAVINKEIGVTTLLTDIYSFQLQFLKEDNYKPTLMLEGTDRQDVIQKLIPILDTCSSELGGIINLASCMIRRQICFNLDSSIIKGDVPYSVSDDFGSYIIITDDEGLGLTGRNIKRGTCEEIPVEIRTKLNGSIYVSRPIHSPKDNLFDIWKRKGLLQNENSIPVLSYMGSEKVSIIIKPVNQEYWYFALYAFFLGAELGLLSLGVGMYKFIEKK